MLNVIMLSLMLSVDMLNVVMLSVVAPFFVLPDSARSKKLGGHQSRQKPFAQNAGFGAKIQTKKTRIFEEKKVAAVADSPFNVEN